MYITDEPGSGKKNCSRIRRHPGAKNVVKDKVPMVFRTRKNTKRKRDGSQIQTSATPKKNSDGEQYENKNKKLRLGEDKTSKVENEKPTCGICFDNVSDRGKMDCCDHMFCYTCIKPWLTRSSSCPHCKREVKNLSRTDNNKSKTLSEKVQKKVLKDTIEQEEGIIDRNNLVLILEQLTYGGLLPNAGRLFQQTIASGQADINSRLREYHSFLAYNQSRQRSIRSPSSVNWQLPRRRNADIMHHQNQMISASSNAEVASSQNVYTEENRSFSRRYSNSRMGVRYSSASPPVVPSTNAYLNRDMRNMDNLNNPTVSNQYHHQTSNMPNAMSSAQMGYVEMNRRVEERRCANCGLAGTMHPEIPLCRICQAPEGYREPPFHGVHQNGNHPDIPVNDLPPYSPLCVSFAPPAISPALYASPVSNVFSNFNEVRAVHSLALFNPR